MANLIALFSGTASQVVIQLLTIPFLLNTRGVKDAAIWLLAFNFSQFTTILDFGISSSIQNSALDLGAKKLYNQIDDQLAQLTLLVVIANSGFLALTYILHKYLFQNLDFGLLSIFIISNLLQFLQSYLEIFTRLENRTSWGIYASNFVRVIEFFAIIAAFQFTRVSLFFGALGGLIAKSIVILGLQVFLPRKLKFLRLGKLNSRLFSLNLRQGFPFLLNRIADIIVLNLVLVVVQDKMKPKELVLFIAVRTFFRLGLQITAVFSHNFGYEMTKSWSTRDFNLMKATSRRSTITTLILSSLGAFIYYSFGQHIFQIWSNQKLSLSSTLLLLGICYSFILSMNVNQKTRFNSINLNFQASTLQVLLSVTYVTFLFLCFDDYSVIMLFSLSTLFEILSLLITALSMRGKIQAYFHTQTQIYDSNLDQGKLNP